jgi:hypothetical protein
MPDTTNTIVNEALMLMGDNAPLVSGEAPNFDDSPAGVAAKFLYTPCVAAVMRSFEWDFARAQVTLAVSGNSAPFPMGYDHEYLYPPLAVEIWQVNAPTIADPNNPLPTNWDVGNAVVGAGPSAAQTKVIWTDVASAIAIVNNNPLPQVWDYSFRDAAVRRLASAFAIALAGRPETAQQMMDSGNMAAALAAQRDG